MFWSFRGRAQLFSVTRLMLTQNQINALKMVISLAWLNKENTVNYFACRGQNQYSFHAGNKNYSILLYIHTYIHTLRLRWSFHNSPLNTQLCSMHLSIAFTNLCLTLVLNNIH